jgi:hypothetical protein
MISVEQKNQVQGGPLCVATYGDFKTFRREAQEIRENQANLRQSQLE